MDQDEKKKKLVYALAAYKQRIVSDSIQRTHLRRTIKVLKTTVLLLGIGAVSSAVIIGILVVRIKSKEEGFRSRQTAAERRIEELASRIESMEAESGRKLTELRAQEALIQELSKRASTSSKRLLENMLQESETRQK